MHGWQQALALAALGAGGVAQAEDAPLQTVRRLAITQKADGALLVDRVVEETHAGAPTTGRATASDRPSAVPAIALAPLRPRFQQNEPSVRTVPLDAPDALKPPPPLNAAPPAPAISLPPALSEPAPPPAVPHGLPADAAAPRLEAPGIDFAHDAPAARTTMSVVHHAGMVAAAPPASKWERWLGPDVPVRPVRYRRLSLGPSANVGCVACASPAAIPATPMATHTTASTVAARRVSAPTLPARTPRPMVPATPLARIVEAPRPAVVALPLPAALGNGGAPAATPAVARPESALAMPTTPAVRAIPAIKPLDLPLPAKPAAPALELPAEVRPVAAAESEPSAWRAPRTGEGRARVTDMPAAVAPIPRLPEPTPAAPKLELPPAAPLALPEDLKTIPGSAAAPATPAKADSSLGWK